MIIESVNSMPSKVVHVFDLRYDRFIVGRSAECDMRISDVSVSRAHSFIRREGRKLVIEDNGSKFGT
jgi:pSer/pThr/pTyr-binding forkhead associated (FHA) protein